ncbi:LacI family DNA-binding transcriptional regulator [Aquibacillus salsiterrae]|uniref:LacI family transcriptional regulator n=1 Tax=Aquibacillus salsiterrae TaxID=2950439 RepID=A0A9X3WH91_9BACI|nr:LacI family DNA-binding transcriptional regulator [Aquibacillus salsiterrae]MDC3418395.1 LacI family transcriptional regulator [Aquibacillus salsiterrae]
MGPITMATIIDVAKRAGVSKSTVSRVLTNSGRIDADTKKRVIKAMEELGYQPSRAAQTLRNKKTKLIAVLVPRVSNHFFSTLIQGMEREAVKHDYQIVLCNTGNDPKKEYNYLKMLENHQIDGLILTAFRNPVELIQQFSSFGPIILVEEYTKDDIFPTITIDHQEAAYKATEHLIKLGHQHIGMVNGPEESIITKDREKGFLKALETYHIPIQEKWICFESFGIQQGRRYIQRVLNNDFYPTAVFAGNDELAVGVIQEAKQQGLDVPQDLAVVGFDDQDIATIIEPNLTTIKQPVEQLGEKAMLLLIDTLQGNKNISKKKILETKLIIRESCGMRV